MNIFNKNRNLKNKHLLEFFPEVILTLPKHIDGGCCVKPLGEQTKRSEEMYIFAQKIRSKYRNSIDFVIPSKCNSRALGKVKWFRFKATLRMSRLKIKKLPALAFDGQILCEGNISNHELIEKKIVNKIQ